MIIEPKKNKLVFSKKADEVREMASLTKIMTCLVSGISTLRGVGVTPGMFQLWMGSWGVSWLIAFPTMMAVLPVVRRLTGKFVEMP